MNLKGFFIFIIVAFLAAIGFGILHASNRTQTQVYNGDKLVFDLKEDWTLKIQSDGAYTIEIASPNSFLLDGGDILLSGEPTEAPLNYDHQYYYRYENDFDDSTEWLIAEAQDADVKVTGEENISCTLEPTEEATKERFGKSIFGSILLWFLLVMLAFIVIL